MKKFLSCLCVLSCLFISIFLIAQFSNIFPYPIQREIISDTGLCVFVIIPTIVVSLICLRTFIKQNILNKKSVIYSNKQSYKDKSQTMSKLKKIRYKSRYINLHKTPLIDNTYINSFNATRKFTTSKSNLEINNIVSDELQSEGDDILNEVTNITDTPVFSKKISDIETLNKIFIELKDDCIKIDTDNIDTNKFELTKSDTHNPVTDIQEILLKSDKYEVKLSVCVVNVELLMEN